jgi:non-ribosomal peptide synthetase component E (peptide arylation enzyme)
MAVGTVRKPAELQEFVDKGLWEGLTWGEIWDRNAEKYPSKEAIIDSKTRLTWGQAKQCIDRLALGFWELGFKKDDVIVVQLPAWAECILVRIACEKAGIIVLPVLRSWRSNEMKYTLETTEARGVVITKEFRDFDYFSMVQEIRPSLPKLKHIFIVGKDVPEGCISLDSMMEEPLEGKYPPDFLKDKELPYTEVSELAHTTGSTGFPKFAEWPAVLAIARTRARNKLWGITSEDNLAALAPGFGGINNPVYHGAPYAAAKMTLLDAWNPGTALDLIQKEKITFFSVVPTMMIQMLSHPDFDKYDVNSLRCITIGGAAASTSLLIEAEKKTGAKVLHGYGSRDIGSTATPSVDDPPEVRWLTVGKTNGWDEIHLLNESGEEVAQGEVGEMVVKAVTGSAGYFKNPEASKAFGEDGMFHTGDLARLDENGNLVIMGRAKNIIIRGGENIYPGEIEGLLETHPKIAQAAVVKMPDPVMGERACAYVALKAGVKLTFDEMVVFLKTKKIAAYKLPERLELIDGIPMVGEGTKVDLKGLEKDIADKLKAEGRI